MPDFITTLGTFGGSGLVALIAWLLLRGMVAQNQRIVDAMLKENRELRVFLQNHMGAVAQSLAETAASLRGISERLEHLNEESVRRENSHEGRALERHQADVAAHSEIRAALAAK